jgi:hypothetical protein
MLLMTGQFDDVVNNELTRGVLREAFGPFVEAELMGAGHYGHELQYPYFRWAVESFRESHTLPPQWLRLRIHRHGDVRL